MTTAGRAVESETLNFGLACYLHVQNRLVKRHTSANQNYRRVVSTSGYTGTKSVPRRGSIRYFDDGMGFHVIGHISYRFGSCCFFGFREKKGGRVARPCERFHVLLFFVSDLINLTDNIPQSRDDLIGGGEVQVPSAGAAPDGRRLQLTYK